MTAAAVPEPTPPARERSIWWILRVACAMCFIGHGAFGIITKEAWIPFFAFTGIPRDAAYTLMPLIGLMDIALGVAILVRPMRAVLAYMALWAVWTASLRPLTGDSVFEMLERAGNYGVPFAFLLWVGRPAHWKGWFERLSLSSVRAEAEPLVRRALAVTIALLLVGHGGLALQQKPLLVEHAAAIGFGPGSVIAAGGFELFLAGLLLLAPRPGLLMVAFFWKMGTEALFSVAGDPIWEFIERGGSYGAPLALAVFVAGVASPRRVLVARTTGAAGAVHALLIGGLLIAGAGTAESQQLSGRAAARVPNGVSVPGLVDSLRAGGYVLACRHTATHHDQTDRGRTRELQRNLTEAGEADAREIGAAVRALRIPIGEVRANPMYRNQETAEYAFGGMVVDSSLAGGAAGLRRLLAEPVAGGANRALVTRIGILNAAFEGHGTGIPDEGDCFVVRPGGEAGFRVIAKLAPRDWTALIGATANRPPGSL